MSPGRATLAISRYGRLRHLARRPEALGVGHDAVRSQARIAVTWVRCPAVCMGFGMGDLTDSLRVLIRVLERLESQLAGKVATQLPTCLHRAWGAYEEAIRERPDLQSKTQDQVYDDIRVHGSSFYDAPGELPARETFKRYLREARRVLGMEKGGQSHGRVGRSVVRRRDL